MIETWKTPQFDGQGWFNTPYDGNVVKVRPGEQIKGLKKGVQNTVVFEGDSPGFTVPVGYSTPEQPLVITGSGEIKGPIVLRNNTGVIIDGLRISGPGKTDRSGIDAQNSSYVMVHGCRIRGFRNGIVAQQATTIKSNVKAISVVRSIIFDNMQQPSSTLHSQGAFFDRVDGVEIIQCGFDGNGRDYIGGGRSSQYNHNIYITGKCRDARVRGNVLSNASATGIQQRCGGENTYNAIYNCPNGMTYGLVNGEGWPTEGGVTGEINFLVIVGGTGAGSKGWSLTLANIRKLRAYGMLITGNPRGQGISFERGDGVHESLDVGIRDAVMEKIFCNHKVNVESDVPQNRNITIKGSYTPNRGNVGGINFDGPIGIPDGPDSSVDWEKTVGKIRGMSRTNWDHEVMGRTLAPTLLKRFGLKDTVPDYSDPIGTIGLRLWSNEIEVPEIKDGQKVASGMNIEAIPPDKVDKVVFLLNGSVVKEEKSYPYFIGGDEGGKPLPYDLPNGPVSLLVEGIKGGKLVSRALVSVIGIPDKKEIDPEADLGKVLEFAYNGIENPTADKFVAIAQELEL